MSGRRWLDQQADEQADQRILDAAGRLFAEQGIAGTGMAQIAAAAGCSRTTVYRCFGDRQALLDAFVAREARRVARTVAAAVAGIDDPDELLAEGVLAAVAAVRNDPALSAWFAPAAVGLATAQARSSALITGLAASLVELGGAGSADEDAALLADWLVRGIVSLLAMPGASPEQERTLVARFLVPSLREGARLGR